MLEPKKTIGEVDFLVWYANRITLSSHEEFLRPLQVYGNVVINKNLELGLLNGIPVQPWAQETYQKYEEDQLVSHSVVKYSAIQVNNGSIVFEDKVSNFDLDMVARNAIPLYHTTGSDKWHEIHAQWTFKVCKACINSQVYLLICLCYVGNSIDCMPRVNIFICRVSAYQSILTFKTMFVALTLLS